MNTATATAFPDIGFHDGVPAEKYHALPAVSSGLLNAHRKSAAHAALYLRRVDEPTDAKDFGTACHVAILEPDDFPSRVLMEPTNPDGSDMDRRTKAYKEALAAAVAAHPGATMLKPFDYRQVSAIRDLVWTSDEGDAPEARAILKRCSRREVSAVWTEAGVGLCKARFDMLGDACAADLKITKDASVRGMHRACAAYGAHIQRVWYAWGASALGLELEDFPFLCVDHTAPVGVRVWRFGPATLAQTHDTIAALLSQHADCVRTGRWPSRRGGVLELPTWAIGDTETSSQPEDESGDSLEYPA